MARPPSYYYNQYMNAVDRHHQRRSYFTYHLRARRWWQSFFFWFIDAAVTNAHIVHQARGGDMDSSTFRNAIAASLLNDAPPKVRRGGMFRVPASGDIKDLPEIRLQGHDHWHSTPDTNDGVAQCAWCSLSGTRSRTKYACSKCRVPLCLKPGSEC